MAAGDECGADLAAHGAAASPAQVPPAVDLAQTGLPSWVLTAVIPGAVLVLGGTATVIALRRSDPPPRD